MSGAYIGAIVAASQKRVVRQLREAGATSPERAVPFEAQRQIDSRQMRHLVSHGVVREAGPGFYWVDEAAWDALRRRRFGMVLVAITVVVAAMVILWLFTQAL